MMYFCRIQRRDFGDLFLTERVSHLNIQSSKDFTALLSPPPRNHELVVVWSSNPQEQAIQLPELLICEDRSEADWAAWITTFGARIRPFSAFARLVPHSDLERKISKVRTPTLGRITWPAAGLILGEVLAASQLPDKSLETIPSAACASTLSFPMFRAAAVYSSFSEWSRLVESWELARRMTAQRQRSIDSEAIARICATVIDAAGTQDAGSLLRPGHRDMRDAVRDLLMKPDRAPYSLLNVPAFSATEERMRGSREDRVVAFADFIKDADSIPDMDSEAVSFMLGYLASRIAPGTIQHAAVLDPLPKKYATALVWYGFCAGLGGSESAGSNADGQRSFLGLPLSARRLVRDLLRPEPVVGAPSCDIAFLELVALSRTSGNPLENLITTTPGTAMVELAPAVWTAVNVSPKPTTEGQARVTRDRVILAEMGAQIERLREMYFDLLGSEHPYDKDDRQRSLLVPPRRRRG